ncbi:hypothetical protein ppKF707_0533 [Metapseudomonas furukawaii]|uniref:Uncharacterized protein n=1 Tax=Metapseudomonas furukawaii TaxID=1149133 RepID=A0AAD1BWT8_METFU|nr:hypothetical protein ppKF707_0533 [Pseudomonas furukawaii]BAU73096.1 hypothetical protein KF707C_14080 [Pseudomonas furukawaii]
MGRSFTKLNDFAVYLGAIKRMMRHLANRPIGCVRGNHSAFLCND